MKIVHFVLGKANPERANGVNRVVHGLATAQVGCGAEVEVWGITPTPSAPTTARHYRLRSFAAARRPWRLVPELQRALVELSPDSVVHFHGGYHPEFHAAARRLRARGLAWVLTPHGAYRRAVLGTGWLKKRLYLALFDSWLVQGARTVHVFSEQERQELLRYAPRASTVVLPNGVDPAELFAAPERVRAGAAPVFGYCGRLATHTKGLDLLLDGFARHTELGGPGELWIVGDGRDRTALEAEAARRGVAGHVRFLGQLLGQEKARALAAMDAFFHPSRHEGMPLAVLEAAATGLPCVLSRETNLAEAFATAQAGFLLPVNDAQALARVFAHCAALHASGKLAEVGRRARELVARDFTWAALAPRSLAELYGSEWPSRWAATTPLDRAQSGAEERPMLPCREAHTVEATPGPRAA